MPKTDEDLALLRRSVAHLVKQLARIAYAPTGDTSHAWHMDWIDRGTLLAAQLTALLELESAARYPSALALARVGLEHFILDRLIILADRWEQVILVPADRDVEEVAEQLRKQVDDGVLLSMRKANEDRFVVVRPGPRLEDDPEQWMSAYTFWDERFDPFRGPAKGQQLLQGYFMDREDHRALARESAELWHRAFSWSALRRNLELNALLPADQLFQLDVHYAFLSAFVHPTSAGYGEALGRNRPRGTPAFNHYVTELLLLYVGRISAREIDSIAEGLQRKPRCELRGWEQLRTLMGEVDDVTAYGWFLGGSPTEYDRVTTANLLEFRDKHRRDPAAMADSDLAYSENPLKRIVRLHWSFQELTTGHVYASPFQRDDAFRYA